MYRLSFVFIKNQKIMIVETMTHEEVYEELALELTITPAEAELLKRYAVEIPHVEILPPDFDELKNIQMDGSALKINIQFKIKPQNPKEL